MSTGAGWPTGRGRRPSGRGRERNAGGPFTGAAEAYAHASLRDGARWLTEEDVVRDIGERLTSGFVTWGTPAGAHSGNE